MEIEGQVILPRYINQVERAKYYKNLDICSGMVNTKCKNYQSRSSIAVIGSLLAAFTLSSCGADSSAATPSVSFITLAPSPAPSPAPTPTPTPTPAPTPTPTAPSEIPSDGLDAIPSNFDVSEWLVPSWGNGLIPDSAKPDVVGAFRFICNPSHLAYADPIVYPNDPSKSHLHQFFGNTLTDENSTYQSLRTTGDSSCNNKLNRSAYWIPAMHDGQGKIVLPDRLTIYYKREPDNAEICTREAGKGCIKLPRGLRYVFGFDMANPTAKTYAHFNCQGKGAKSGNYKNLVALIEECPDNEEIGAIVSAPNCWDGVNLDSPNHRDHMAYTARDRNSGQPSCPASHPWLVPTFTVSAWYTSDQNVASWYFDSDRMPGMPERPAGSTFHSDWFGAWDDDVMDKWTSNCVNLLLNCSGGDLGNGEQLKMFAGFSWTANPRLVDPPTRN